MVTPLDVALEHYIRMIKLLKKKFGPHQTNQTILNRYIHALPFNKQLMANFDEMSNVINNQVNILKSLL